MFVTRVIAIGIVLAATVRLAWITDDALITLRTALNLTHGWGPGYNASESVQAYTHPLWFVLWLIVGSTTDAWILGILVLSLILTSAAVAIVVWQTRSVLIILTI